MPELPEVETVVRNLQSIVGCKIYKIINSDKKFRVAPPKNFSKILLNKNITQISRRSKYILIHLQDDKELEKFVLVIHLGMTGKILLNIQSQHNKHDHLILNLDNQILFFNDTRRFGLYTVIAADSLYSNSLFCRLGVEPLSSRFNFKLLSNLLLKKTAPIKSVIMQANLIVGIGNIYASECLFRAKISPLRPANSLNIHELKLLCKMIKKTLKLAIQMQGSSFSDYINPSGKEGSFQQKFQVYSRVNQKCYNCQTPIVSIKLSGRSTFYCNRCQL